MRDSVTENLRDRLKDLWEEFEAHRKKKYPDDAVVHFIASSRSRVPSEGTILCSGNSIGYVRVRFHPVLTKNRWGTEIPEWKRKVRDIAISDITDVHPVTEKETDHV